MSKINVKIIADEHEDIDISESGLKYLSQSFEFKYGFKTKINKLLMKTCKTFGVGTENDCSIKFQLLHNDNRYFLNPNVRIKKLINYLGIEEQITFVYLFGVPGGKTLDETNGIRYFLHPKETNHSPHIHAKFSGEEISIYLITGKIEGSFKSKTKMKQAQKYVNDNKEYLMDAYVKYTNGIVVFY